MANKKKILITTWHTPHQYDFIRAMKDHADFFILENLNKRWAGRPIPDNATTVPYYEPGKYDFAILNIDQQCVNQSIYKSTVLPQLLKTITDIPVIILNHASPVYPEYLQKNGMSPEMAEEQCRSIVKEIIGERPMVVNSHTAASNKEW